jgi:hypothetical protein
MVAFALLVGSTAMAQNTVTLKGVLHDNRYKEGVETKQMESEYLGNSISLVSQGIYKVEWDGTNLSALVRDPAVVKEEILTDPEKAQWANNFKMMYANSGGGYVDGYIYTIMSRDEQSTVDEELFAVRQWDAKTGELLSNKIYPKSATLESAGMCYYNGKVYGLFYLTGQDLPEEITSDPEYFEDQDADMTDGDAGYCLCTIDLATMTITPITPGLYYYNFVTFAINSEGRAFALTSGGTSNAGVVDGKVKDINGNLAGAQLYEFDLTTGLLKTKTVQAVDSQTGETYTEQVSIYEHGTGYCSQARRQSACFSKSNPNIMYWNGYINSGKGFNDWGSWSSLSDKEWRTNGKYDTAIYAVDITTGEATLLSKIDNRCTFSALWADGDDASDGVGFDVMTGKIKSATGIHSIDNGQLTMDKVYYDLSGRRVAQPSKGLYIINGKKVMVK